MWISCHCQGTRLLITVSATNPVVRASWGGPSLYSINGISEMDVSNDASTYLNPTSRFRSGLFTGFHKRRYWHTSQNSFCIVLSIGKLKRGLINSFIRPLVKFLAATCVLPLGGIKKNQKKRSRYLLARRSFLTERIELIRNRTTLPSILALLFWFIFFARFSLDSGLPRCRYFFHESQKIESLDLLVQIVSRNRLEKILVRQFPILVLAPSFMKTSNTRAPTRTHWHSSMDRGKTWSGYLGVGGSCLFLPNS